MAKIIPALNRQTLAKMTSGEKRVARRLEALLEDDYVIWYDIPVGSKRRNPDFIILHPTRGLLILEVKDWKASTIKNMTKTTVDLLVNDHMISQTHPLEQAREGTYEILRALAKDPLLCHAEGLRKGKLIIPYGWGVVFTNISRNQVLQMGNQDSMESILPEHLIMYSDDLSEKVESEAFQEKLWDMFNYKFGSKLTLPQIDRIRWHMFPEIRISENQLDLFADQKIEDAVPEIVKIMDIQQEQLARSLGEGHRVIHGVAGSGKTLILGYRCVHLATVVTKPILVLCFNISLAAKLRAFIVEKGISSKVQVYHFHDWCTEQLKMYHVRLIPSEREIWEQKVDTVISAVDKGQIPRAQYSALLIDEGHDFEPDWLKLVVQMVDPEINSLLLLYDDAQSIYKKKKGLGFSLSSVGIEAAGRTTILKMNYRNTKEILFFAYKFARQYFDPESASEDHIPLVEPEAFGNSGPEPIVKVCGNLKDEVEYSVETIQKWRSQGQDWRDMSVLYTDGRQGVELANRLKRLGIPHLWMGTKEFKKAYNPSNDVVSIMSIHSSKGLEFASVIIMGIDQLRCSDENRLNNAKLLYVGMTRSQKQLVVMASGSNEFSQSLVRNMS